MRPYELLVRFKNDGQVAGAQARYIETVNGRDFELDPVPLDTAGPEFAAFANQFSAAAVAERDQLAAQSDKLKSERDQLAAERDQLAADRDKLTAERDRLTAERDQLATAAARVPGLELQLATAIAELDAIKNPPGPDLSTREGLRQYVSMRRYAHETGGIFLEDQPISTERDETGHWFPRFYDAYLWLNGDPSVRAINPNGVYPYKPKNGEPVTLTALQVVRAYQCMAWFINACFAAEEVLYLELRNRDLPIDIVERIDNAWPSNHFKWQPPTP